MTSCLRFKTCRTTTVDSPRMEAILMVIMLVAAALSVNKTHER